MARRTRSGNDTWTPQQRFFVLVALALLVLAMAISILRMQSTTAPPSPGDSARVVSHALAA